MEIRLKRLLILVLLSLILMTWNSAYAKPIVLELTDFLSKSIGGTITANVTIEGSLNATGSFIVPSLSSCDTINTTANGTFICGTDETGTSGVTITLPFANITGEANDTQIPNNITINLSYTIGEFNRTINFSNDINLDGNILGSDFIIGWGNISSYPSACSSSETITSLGDLITCSTISITESQISDLIHTPAPLLQSGNIFFFNNTVFDNSKTNFTTSGDIYSEGYINTSKNLTSDWVIANIDCSNVKGSSSDLCTISGGGTDTQKEGAGPYLYNDSTKIYWNESTGNKTYYTQEFANSTFVDIAGDTMSGDLFFGVNLIIGTDLKLEWGNLTGYPSACSTSETLTGLGDSLTCSSISITESQISDLSHITNQSLNLSAIPGRANFSNSSAFWDDLNDPTDLTITESQISDLSHTTDTGAIPDCSGSETQLANGSCTSIDLYIDTTIPAGVIQDQNQIFSLNDSTRNFTGTGWIDSFKLPCYLIQGLDTDFCNDADTNTVSLLFDGTHFELNQSAPFMMTNNFTVSSNATHSIGNESSEGWLDQIYARLGFFVSLEANLASSVGYLFSNLDFSGTTGFSDLTDDDTQSWQQSGNTYCFNNTADCSTALIDSNPSVGNMTVVNITVEYLQIKGGGHLYNNGTDDIWE